MIAKKYVLALVSASGAAAAFAALTLAAGIGRSVYLLPVIFLLPVCVFLQFKERAFDCSPETMMNEAPSVIGMMSVFLSSGGSFDNAVRDVAKNGPENISKIFSKIVLDADCKAISDIKTAVISTISSFPKELSAFKRAMHIVVTAFETADVKESAAMMKDAESIVLEGLRSIGETYSSSLNSPCMLIFGLGIMLPMILISMLPMLTIGGSFAVSFIDSDMVSVIVLIGIPVIVGAVIFSLRGKNPFFKAELNASDIRYIAPMVLVLPIYIVCTRYGFTSDIAISAGFIAAGLCTFMMIFPSIKKEKDRVRIEDVLKDSLFEIGNRLSMGENFENAIRKVFSGRKDCRTLYDRIERELVLCRGDIESAIVLTMGGISEKLTGYYCEVYRASRRDLRNAGRLASSIAHQIQDQNTVRKDIENKLKSTMDMMTGTSAIFAPVILGMSIVMLGPISEMTGHVFFENIGLILAIYLVELAALIAFMSSNLMCRGKTVDVMARFSLMMPLALIVFLVCSSISV